MSACDNEYAVQVKRSKVGLDAAAKSLKDPQVRLST